MSTKLNLNKLHEKKNHCERQGNNAHSKQPETFIVYIVH